MNDRLQTELQRLYLPPPEAGAATGGSPLLDAAGAVRALVLEWAAPADWPALGAVWQGVQTDLGLPAPAIAVSGTDGCQLWFSLAAPVPAPQAMALLDRLRARFPAAASPARVRAWPCWDGATPPRLQHAAPVPALQPDGERWSAFIAPDLAPMFAETPWLDLPPGRDGQAALLARLASIAPRQLQATLDALPPAATPAPSADGAALGPPAGMPAAAMPAQNDPRRFLLEVMNDERVALALRIEAAKALLMPGG